MTDNNTRIALNINYTVIQVWAFIRIYMCACQVYHFFIHESVQYIIRYVVALLSYQTVRACGSLITEQAHLCAHEQ